jgi:hypothetical protein
MHLVLAARRRLAASYGAGYQAVAAGLSAALAARAAAGVASLSYDPEEGLPAFAVAPAPLEPAALAAQLAGIARAAGLRNGIIESLWIIGGPDVVPFGSLPNPMRDRDGPLLSDAPYGLAGPDNPLARWPVGRTPDAAPPEPGLLAALLDRVAAAHRAGPQPPGPLLALSAARWAGVTAAVLAAASPAAPPPLLAPPLLAGALPAGLLEGKRLIYCNLHGVLGSAAWYGQPSGDSERPPALRPADLEGRRLAGAAVVSQACFAARLSPAGDGRALAVALLAAGADALVGALGLTYGAPDLPPGESDLLARWLLATLTQPGLRLGAAFLQAQAALIRELLLRQGQLEADDLKTLLGFLLYGDPALLRQ